MPNIGLLLKDEISRLCRREIRQQVEPMKDTLKSLRRDNADLKRQVQLLERQAATASKRAARTADVDTATAADDSPKRFVPKGLRTLRSKMGVSAADIARLVGVSTQSVYHWEQGKSTPRKEQLAQLAGLRGIGKREMQARIDALG